MTRPRNPDRLVRTTLVWLALAGSIALPAPVAADDDLGRLFFTPQERRELDRRRANNLAAEDAPAAVESLATVNGRVTRSSGRTTTWINGVAHDDVERSRDPARVTVERGGGTRVPVKVGETLDRSRGAVQDPLGDGEIRIRSAPGR